MLEKHTSKTVDFEETQSIKKEAKIEKEGLIALYVFLSILMALVLIALTCAVWCWAIIGGEVIVVILAVVATICFILLSIFVISSMRRSIDERFPEEKLG